MKRRSQKKERGAKPTVSKYARKQIDKSAPTTNVTTRVQEQIIPETVPRPAPPPEPPAVTTHDEVWEVKGTITRVFSKGFLFVMTEGEASERVFVHSRLYKSFVDPEVSNLMRCQVTRNQHGLQATKVLCIEKPASA